MNRMPPEDLDETFGDATPKHENDFGIVDGRAHDHDWIDGRIAVGGGVWRDSHVAHLRSEGITHVIDCRSEASAEMLYRDSGIELFCCRTDDDGAKKGERWFGRGVPYALGILARPGTKLLVHCAAGVNRGPSMAYAILRAMGIETASAEAMIRMARPCVALLYRDDAERWLAAHR
jgi:hypothetical protein